MINLPKRSITHFFIPLIDVLVLLFCVFLFLPIVGQSDSPDPLSKQKSELLQKQQDSDSSTQLLSEIEKLRADRTQNYKGKFFTRVLEIDSESGELFHRNPDKTILKNKDAVQTLINQDRLSSLGKEIFYLILFPRDTNSSHPTRGQRESYENWVNGIVWSFDIPGIKIGN